MKVSFVRRLNALLTNPTNANANVEKSDREVILSQIVVIINRNTL